MNIEQTVAQPNVYLMPSLYDETVDLLLAARYYFGNLWPDYEPYLSVEERLHFASEMSRITMRLTSVMAWLTAQRAVASGDLDEDEARNLYRLHNENSCLFSNPEIEAILPIEMRTILEASRKLYLRVYRIESQLMGETPLE